MSYADEFRTRSPPPRSLRSFTDSVTVTPSMAESLGRPQSIYSASGERRPVGPRDRVRSPSTTRPTTPSQRIPSPSPSQTTPFDTAQSRPVTPIGRYPVNTASSDHDLPPIPPFPIEQLSRQPTIEELERVVSPLAARRMLFETSPAKATSPPIPSTSVTMDVSGTSALPRAVEPLTIKKRKVAPSMPSTGTSGLQRTPPSRRLSVLTRTERAVLANATPIPDEPMVISAGSSSIDLWAPDEILTLARSTRVDVSYSRVLIARPNHCISIRRSLLTGL